MSKARNLAIVPAFNEGGSVARVVESIHTHARDFDVLVIDDGSSDDTAELARSAGARVIVHPFNLGIGAAVQSGYQYADRNGYRVAVQVDGDGQHDPAFIPALLDALATGADIAWGTRFIESAGYRVPLSRRTGRRIFALMMSAIAGQKVTDPTSGFRAVNRRAIELFASDYPCDYPEVEAIQLMHANGLRFTEVPVEMKQRSSGRSSINATESVYYMAKVLLAVAIGTLRAKPAPSAAAISPKLGV